MSSECETFVVNMLIQRDQEFGQRTMPYERRVSLTYLFVELFYTCTYSFDAHVSTFIKATLSLVSITSARGQNQRKLDNISFIYTTFVHIIIQPPNVNNTFIISFPWPLIIYIIHILNSLPFVPIYGHNTQLRSSIYNVYFMILTSFITHSYHNTTTIMIQFKLCLKNVTIHHSCPSGPCFLQSMHFNSPIP